MPCTALHAKTLGKHSSTQSKEPSWCTLHQTTSQTWTWSFKDNPPGLNFTHASLIPPDLMEGSKKTHFHPLTYYNLQLIFQDTLLDMNCLWFLFHILKRSGRHGREDPGQSLPTVRFMLLHESWLPDFDDRTLCSCSRNIKKDSRASSQDRFDILHRVCSRFKCSCSWWEHWAESWGHAELCEAQPSWEETSIRVVAI
jgi:hypothetical protein